MIRQIGKDLSKIRFEQAIENLEDAKILFNKNSYKSANNRAYYSIFHAIKAILALEEVDFKKHSSIIAYFNKNYISADRFPKKTGKMISRAMYIREKSDYDDFYIASKEETKEQIDSAEVIIKETEKY